MHILKKLVGFNNTLEEYKNQKSKKLRKLKEALEEVEIAKREK